MRSLALALLALCCARNDPAPREEPASAASSTAARSTPPPRRVFVDALPVAGDQPVFALRGSKEGGKAVGVFLHGHCSHGMGYLQAFQYAAAEAGRFVALQGDVHCGTGPMRAWSGDIEGLNRRIERALRVYLDDEPPEEILVGGSSQGVERAIALARRFPKKYRRLILSSGFREVPSAGLGPGLRAYFLIGQHENRWPTERTVQLWQKAGLAAEVKIIPGAGHGDFHGQGDRLMREAFRFVTRAD